MEKKGAAALRWLDTAVKGVRFGPDRAAVRAELEAHLEDKEADLRRNWPGFISPGWGICGGLPRRRSPLCS